MDLGFFDRFVSRIVLAVLLHLIWGEDFGVWG